MSKVRILILLFHGTSRGVIFYIRTQEHQLVMIRMVFLKYSIICTHYVLVVWSCMWPINHHVESLIHCCLIFWIIRRIISFLFFYLFSLGLPELSTFGPDKPILLVSNLRSYTILKLLVNYSCWLCLFFWRLRLCVFDNLRN